MVRLSYRLLAMSVFGTSAIFAQTSPSPSVAAVPFDSVTNDPLGRLTYVSGKQAVPCPRQRARTAVLLLIGQSNAGNHAERMHRSTHGAAVVNFFDGRCYVAASPLLGTTSVEGESWTLLGNKLIERSAFDTVILVPAAIGGSSIVRWQQGADLNTMLLGVLAGLKSSSYTPTHILWHQGESNFVEGTSAQDYTRMFQSLLTSIRQQGVHAPIFVSVATRCAPPPPWVADNPVSRAQRALPDAHQQIFAGVNTDSLITTADRRDGCHFGASGQEKFADAWNTIL